MDWRDLRAHGAERGPAFYHTALTYAQYLWQRGCAARAVLCLDRAFGSDLPPDPEPRPALPYAALAWMLVHLPPKVFIGNPRIHFQHLADRMSGPRLEQRRWRAWACWAIARQAMPELPGDIRCIDGEPTLETIAGRLSAFGRPDEAALWRAVLAGGQSRVHS
jgi:hypothetical protein